MRVCRQTSWRSRHGVGMTEWQGRRLVHTCLTCGNGLQPGHVRRTQTLSRQRDSELAESGRLTHQLAGLGAQWEAAVAAAREQE